MSQRKEQFQLTMRFLDPKTRAYTKRHIELHCNMSKDYSLEREEQTKKKNQQTVAKIRTSVHEAIDFLQYKQGEIKQLCAREVIQQWSQSILGMTPSIGSPSNNKESSSTASPPSSPTNRSQKNQEYQELLHHTPTSILKHLTLVEPSENTHIQTNLLATELSKFGMFWHGSYYLFRVLNERDITQTTVYLPQSDHMIVFIMKRESIDRSINLSKKCRMLLIMLESHPDLSIYLPRKAGYGPYAHHASASRLKTDGSAIAKLREKQQTFSQIIPPNMLPIVEDHNEDIQSIDSESLDSDGQNSGRLSDRIWSSSKLFNNKNKYMVLGKALEIDPMPHGQGVIITVVDPDNKPILGNLYEYLESRRRSVETERLKRLITSKSIKSFKSFFLSEENTQELENDWKIEDPFPQDERGELITTAAPLVSSDYFPENDDEPRDEEFQDKEENNVVIPIQILDTTSNKRRQEEDEEEKGVDNEVDSLVGQPPTDSLTGETSLILSETETESESSPQKPKKKGKKKKKKAKKSVESGTEDEGETPKKKKKGKKKKKKATEGQGESGSESQASDSNASETETKEGMLKIPPSIPEFIPISTSSPSISRKSPSPEPSPSNGTPIFGAPKLISILSSKELSNSPGSAKIKKRVRISFSDGEEDSRMSAPITVLPTVDEPKHFFAEDEVHEEVSKPQQTIPVISIVEELPVPLESKEPVTVIALPHLQPIDDELILPPMEDAIHKIENITIQHKEENKIQQPIEEDKVKDIETILEKSEEKSGEKPDEKPEEKSEELIEETIQELPIETPIISEETIVPSNDIIEETPFEIKEPETVVVQVADEQIHSEDDEEQSSTHSFKFVPIVTPPPSNRSQEALISSREAELGRHEHEEQIPILFNTIYLDLCTQLTREIVQEIWSIEYEKYLIWKEEQNKIQEAIRQQELKKQEEILQKQKEIEEFQLLQKKLLIDKYGKQLQKKHEYKQRKILFITWKQLCLSRFISLSYVKWITKQCMQKLIKQDLAKNANRLFKEKMNLFDDDNNSTHSNGSTSSLTQQNILNASLQANLLSTLQYKEKSIESYTKGNYSYYKIPSTHKTQSLNNHSSESYQNLYKHNTLAPSLIPKPIRKQPIIANHTNTLLPPSPNKLLSQFACTSAEELKQLLGSSKQSTNDDLSSFLEHLSTTTSIDVKSNPSSSVPSTPAAKALTQTYEDMLHLQELHKLSPIHRIQSKPKKIMFNSTFNPLDQQYTSNSSVFDISDDQSLESSTMKPPGSAFDQQSSITSASTTMPSLARSLSSTSWSQGRFNIEKAIVPSAQFISSNDNNNNNTNNNSTTNNKKSSTSSSDGQKRKNNSSKALLSKTSPLASISASVDSRKKEDSKGSKGGEPGVYIQSLKQVQRLGYVPCMPQGNPMSSEGWDSSTISSNDQSTRSAKRKPWAYAAHWADILTHFLQKHALENIPSIAKTPPLKPKHKGNNPTKPRPPFYELKKLLKQLSRVLLLTNASIPTTQRANITQSSNDESRLKPGLLSTEEMICALAETNGSIGEILQRLQDPHLGFVSEIQLVCGALNVKSMVCSMPYGSELFKHELSIVNGYQSPSPETSPVKEYHTNTYEDYHNNYNDNYQNNSSPSNSFESNTKNTNYFASRVRSRSPSQSNPSLLPLRGSISLLDDGSSIQEEEGENEQEDNDNNINTTVNKNKRTSFSQEPIVNSLTLEGHPSLLSPTSPSSGQPFFDPNTKSPITLPPVIEDLELKKAKSMEIAEDNLLNPLMLFRPQTLPNLRDQGKSNYVFPNLQLNHASPIVVSRASFVSLPPSTQASFSQPQSHNDHDSLSILTEHSHIGGKSRQSSISQRTPNGSFSQSSSENTITNNKNNPLRKSSQFTRSNSFFNSPDFLRASKQWNNLYASSKDEQDPNPTPMSSIFHNLSNENVPLEDGDSVGELSSPHIPSYTSPSRGGSLDYSSVGGSSNSTKSMRKSFRIHQQLVNEHFEETAHLPIAVMCRRDALKAQQEETLLKSDKLYIRESIEHKVKHRLRNSISQNSDGSLALNTSSFMVPSTRASIMSTMSGLQTPQPSMNSSMQLSPSDSILSSLQHFNSTHSSFLHKTS